MLPRIGTYINVLKRKTTIEPRRRTVKVVIMKVLICALVALFAITDVECKGRVACYYNPGAAKRSGNGQFGIDNLPLKECTHVLIAFIGIGPTGEVQILDSDDYEGFSKFTSLKKTHKKVKFMVVLGGWDEGGAKYSQMVSTNATRAKFTKSVIKFLDEYDFDGIDLDWEYPGAKDRDGVPEDKQGFLYFVQELRQALDEDGKGRELTAAVPITQVKIDDGYYAAALCKILNAVYLMTYDLHGSWDGVALPHSALYKAPRDTGANEHINARDGLKLWEKEGCPANKLVLGIPFYGRSYQLTSASNHDIGAPITGPAPAANYTNSPGTWAYYEICQKLKYEAGWTRAWDKYGKVPYAYNEDNGEWVGYDDPQSVRGKMKFIKDNGYLGCMTWSIDMDDFRGICGKAFPLIRIMHSHMKSYTVPESYSTN